MGKQRTRFCVIIVSLKEQMTAVRHDLLPFLNKKIEVKKGRIYDMPLYKRCSRCGKRIPSGTKCACIKERHKEYDKYSRDNKSKQYYRSNEWRASRAVALELDQGIDVYLFMTEGIVKIADTVHHIAPLRDNWESRNDINNLMSLHHDTHSTIEKMYKKDRTGTEKLLKKMLLEYRSRGGAV